MTSFPADGKPEYSRYPTKLLQSLPGFELGGEYHDPTSGVFHVAHEGFDFCGSFLAVASQCLVCDQHCLHGTEFHGFLRFCKAVRSFPVFGYFHHELFDHLGFPGDAGFLGNPLDGPTPEHFLEAGGTDGRDVLDDDLLGNGRVGETSRIGGYLRAVSDNIRLLILVAIILAVGAVYEAFELLYIAGLYTT